jgi:hypothetical protein
LKNNISEKEQLLKIETAKNKDYDNIKKENNDLKIKLDDAKKNYEEDYNVYKIYCAKKENNM